jgi:hypothetical protein
MHKGTVYSKLAAERAWSLLEDWSPYTEKKYAPERVASAMNGYRKEAYDLVSNGSKDVSVLTCAHCVGVMLYCQYRGFGCAKEDFVSGYPNPFMLKTGLAAQLGSKVASLVAGLFHQGNGDHDQAIHHFEQCRGVPMANVMRGDSYCALQKWREAYEAYQRATKLDHVVGIHCLGGMLKKGWGGKLDVIKGAQLEQDAWKRGYWRIVDAYYEGIGINGRKAADTFGSGRSTRSSAVQDLTAQPSPAPAVKEQLPLPPSTRRSAVQDLTAQPSPAPAVIEQLPLPPSWSKDPPYCTEQLQHFPNPRGPFQKNDTKRFRDAVCVNLRLHWVPVHDDGDCFFASVSKAMAYLPKPIRVTARALRTSVCEWLGVEYVQEYGADGVWVQGTS